MNNETMLFAAVNFYMVAEMPTTVTEMTAFSTTLRQHIANLKVINAATPMLAVTILIENMTTWLLDGHRPNVWNA